MSPFAYDFMRTALAACTAAAVVAGAVGYFMVLRGETFAGHALAHVGFPGATGAVLVGVAPIAGLVTATVLAGLGIAVLGERAHRDVAIGVVLSVSLGLGLLFLHFYTSTASLATNILFGNVLGISAGTVLTLSVLAAAALLGLAAIARPLIFTSLQPELAEARGVPTALVSSLFLVLVAVTTAETIQVVGILLSFALLVAPAASAVRLTSRVATGVAVSVALAVAVAWAGLLLAFYTDWPTSFWITALGGAIYLGVLAATRRG